MSPRTAATKAQRLKGTKGIMPVADKSPAVNKRLSPGRKKPKNNPDSANTMAKTKKIAVGPAQVRRYNESIMGTLYVVATPIGNLEDITLRSIRLLFESKVVACEDTRHTGNLLKLLEDRYSGILNPQITNHKPKKYISIRDFNENLVIDKIILELQKNDVALVSDAGTPLISDPGYKLVKKCRELGIKIVPIPGPCAAITALSGAGLPTNKFTFLGFLPKKWEIRPGETTIIYESPLRINKTIDEIKLRYPSAQIVLAHELTKLHEEIYSLDIRHSTLDIRGEYVILVYQEIPSSHRSRLGNIQK